MQSARRPATGGTDPAIARDGAIDAFRWICILAVLFHHSLFPSRQSDPFLEFMLAAKPFLTWCVPGFFFASGWVSRPGRIDGSGIVHRASRLLKPFVGVNLVLWAFFASMQLIGAPIPPEVHPFDPGYLIRQSLFLQGFGPQFYFLPALLFVGVAGDLLNRHLPRRAVACLCIALPWVVPAAFGTPESCLGSDLDRYPFYLSAYLSGSLLAGSNRDGVVALLFFAQFSASALWMSFGRGSSPFFAWLPIPLFLVLRAFLRGSSQSWAVRWSSGTLYLWHAPVLMTAASIVLAKIGLVDALGLVGAWAIAIAGSQLAHRALSRTAAGPWLTL